jgi:hypothetical protein
MNFDLLLGSLDFVMQRYEICSEKGKMKNEE